MNKFHETLYKTPEIIKLFIVYCLFFYFLNEVFPSRNGFVEVLGIALLAGLGVGVLTALFQKPKEKRIEIK